KALYLALVLTKDAAEPKLIPLGDAVKLNGVLRSAYQSQQGLTRGISTAPPGAPGGSGSGSGAGLPGAKEAYGGFWKPIEPALSGIKRVYVASDGLLNQFPIGLLADESGKYLFEKYDLRLLNSTKDLAEAGPAPAARTAVLMGNPSFDLSEIQQRTALAKLNAGAASVPGAPPGLEGAAAAATRGLNTIGGKLSALPAT